MQAIPSLFDFDQLFDLQNLQQRLRSSKHVVLRTHAALKDFVGAAMINRHKYSFAPDPNRPPTHLARRTLIAQLFVTNKAGQFVGRGISERSANPHSSQVLDSLRWTDRAREAQETKPSSNISEVHRARDRSREIQHRFGVDFSGTAIRRSALPSCLGMWGLAAGRDVLLAHDAPSVATREGLRLLAHELAHTLQHRILAAPPERAVLLEDPELEAGADRFADAVVATLCDGVAPDFSAVPSAPGPAPLSKGLFLQAAFRHKFEFIPAAHVPAKWAFLVAKIASIFDTYAREKHELATADYQAMQNALALAAGGNAHPILHAYEKAHLQHGKDWHDLADQLLKRCAGQIQFSEDPSSVNLMRSDSIRILARYSTEHGVQNTLVVLGSVNFGRFRFRPIAAQPAGAWSTVVERIAEPGKHYIYAPTTDTYVRRFVARGLNQLDALNLDLDLDLQAFHAGNAQEREIYSLGQTSRHNVPAGAALLTSQQLLSHTRGWKKRYISTGVSNRPALSTRGAPFSSVFGAITIDLAMVDPLTIFPLNSHLAAERLLGGDVTALKVVNARAAQPADARTLGDEEFLAMRDVLRTRELVIAGAVPHAAVHARRQVGVVLGIAGQSGPRGDHPVDANPAVGWPASNERLAYPWKRPGGPGGTGWRFFAYASPALADTAAQSLPPGVERHIFGTYVPVYPPGTN
ncbi:eCIS core domain-containing protein [Variovorax sp. GB1P17]|uniref:eCIS core domain-containing protein n=1 Tax=Variovorax sp. GB1P17 TaxID=3443740 RepID=UPI003F471B52